MKKYDYIIIGAGIAGCCVAYFLNKYEKNILLVDKNSDVGKGASGAAGAFLSPLLGKPNDFKDLVNKALVFSTQLYKKEFPDFIQNCGTLRLPKDEKDKDKFNSYKPYIDFEYSLKDDGYFFDIGSTVSVDDICKNMTKDVNKKFDYEVTSIKKIDDTYVINGEFKTKNIIFTTGANTQLIDEKYFTIRPVWGQKINVLTTTKTNINYHKACSVSKAKKINEQEYQVSIGATHNRFDKNMGHTSYNLNLRNINDIEHNTQTKDIIQADTNKLINLANDIKVLENIRVIDIKMGARACSTDYFPLVGELVDSKKSIEKYPHILNGSFIKEENLDLLANIYVLNGVGGRGFVLSPYLAYNLVESIINNKKLEKNITTYRLFKRWAKRLKNKV